MTRVQTIRNIYEGLRFRPGENAHWRVAEL